MSKPLTIEQINNKRPALSRLTAIEFCEPKIAKSGKKITVVMCRCECGVIKQVAVKCLFANTYSCGCYNKELYTATLGTHTKYDTIESVIETILPDNRLTPIRFLQPKFNKKGYKLPIIECRCSCGKVVPIDMFHFVNHKIKSCGCLRNEKCGENFRKYPGNIRGIQNSYDAMIARCYNKRHRSYKYYGGANPPVIVCDEWRNDYMSFLHWAKENGWKSGLKIDKDKKGNGLLYSPTTCCWLTHSENMKYQRRSMVFFYQGMDRTVHEIGKMVGKKGETLKRLINGGLTLEEAISKPSYKHLKVCIWEKQQLKKAM